ncbi:MAG TPA: DsbA family oxidoreductase [Hyphomicrobiaceae bacterium]|nr:DsbA family oxidoreductase [Hyphomicrobiaceae bacterium]
MSATLPIIVYSDVICPWCYVGKRRLEAALGAPGVPGQVGFAWRPFQLNPDMPADGIERSVYRARKFGAERSAELDRNMTETGREVGIDFAFDRMQRTPNTRLAHRLIWEAGRQGRQDAIVNRLFQAYFEEGLDIGSAEILARLAAESGLEAAGVEQALGGADSLEAVVDLEEQGRRLGIQGVPFFVLLGKYGISGAQPPEFWRETLPKIAAEASKSVA